MAGMPCFYQQYGGYGRELLDEKSKSLLFPGAAWAWLQMTSAY